ncbi:MAG TPA: TcpQ domain-containing protein [Eoetvoesiella sp.]
MLKTVITISFIPLLAGCTALTDMALFGKPAAAKYIESAAYSFAWRLSGDRAVAPLQVFDNGHQMWLQFAPGQAIPAIFAHTKHGDRPLSYRQEGPYVVLGSVWPSLVLRGGHLSSHVNRITEPSRQAIPADSTQASELPIEEAVAVKTDGLPPDLADSVRLSAQTIAVPEPGVEHLAAALTASSFALAPAGTAAPSEVGHYTVGPDDQNLRVALSRWAQTAGWTFGAEHWAVDADIPIVGSATFQAQFKTAVQELVASTELADRPLQPCFYSNRVLRVVPYAQSCDRTASLAEAS